MVRRMVEVINAGDIEGTVNEFYQLMLFTFTAGVLTTLVIEELVPEAHEEVADSPLSPIMFVGGFALAGLPQRLPSLPEDHR